MKYLIYVSDDCGEYTWKAPNEKARDCMLASAREFGFKVLKVEGIN